MFAVATLLPALLLLLLANNAAATICDDPPNKATQTYLDTLVSSGCTTINDDLVLGFYCETTRSCSGGTSSGGISGTVNLGAVETITGKITIYGSNNIPNVTAPNLKSLGGMEFGYVDFGSNYYWPLLEVVDMPALETVTGDIIFDTHPDELTTINFPSLKTIGGDLTIDWVPELDSTLAMPALEEITGELFIHDCPNLETFNVTSLKSVGSINTLEDNNGISNFYRPVYFTLTRGVVDATTYTLLEDHAGAKPKYLDEYDPDDCPQPPIQCTMAYLALLESTGCKRIVGDLHLGSPTTSSPQNGGVSGLVNLSSVVNITGQITLYGSANVHTIKADHLLSFGSFTTGYVYSNANYYWSKLQVFDMPVLETIRGSMRFNKLPDNDQTITVPNLKRIEGDLWFKMFWKVEGPIEFPALEVITGKLVIDDCPNLNTFNVTKLKSVGSVEAEDNNGINNFYRPIFVTVTRGVLESATYDTLDANAGIQPKYLDEYDPDDCPQPPIKADRAYIDLLNSTGCKRIVGDLFLGAACTYTTVVSCSSYTHENLAGTVNLSMVEEITGRLTMHGDPNVQTITADYLTSVKSFESKYTYHQGNFRWIKLVTLDLPALTTIDGVFLIEANGGVLTTINLPSLRAVTGDFILEECDKIAGVLQLLALEYITGDVSFSDNRLLTKVNVTSLGSIGGIDKMENNNYDDPVYEPLSFIVSRCLTNASTTLLDDHANSVLEDLDTVCTVTSEPTQAPTTTPTTGAPTTKAPTLSPTVSPTTGAPSTGPTTGAPSTGPTTAGPTTQAPSTTPTTGAPSTTPTTGAPTGTPTTTKPRVDGLVMDATTKNILGGVTLSLRVIANKQEVANYVSDDGGHFFFETDTLTAADAVPIEIVASYAGYFDRIVEITAVGYKQILLSPVIDTVDTYRFVLEWDEMPEDLDAHLLLTSTGCEVYWDDKFCALGSSSAVLDVDSRFGFGPETLTITGAKSNGGVANYFVEQWTAEGSLATSGATVAVYNENGLARVLKVPNCLTDFWNVAQVDMSDGSLIFMEDLADDLDNVADPCRITFPGDTPNPTPFSSGGQPTPFSSGGQPTPFTDDGGNSPGQPTAMPTSAEDGFSAAPSRFAAPVAYAVLVALATALL